MGGVAPRLHTAGIFPRRALPAGRRARLGATHDVHQGLLAVTGARKIVIVLMLLGAAALEVRQLEASRAFGAEQTEKATFAGGCF